MGAAATERVVEGEQKQVRTVGADRARCTSHDFLLRRAELLLVVVVAVTPATEQGDGRWRSDREGDGRWRDSGDGIEGRAE